MHVVSKGAAHLRHLDATLTFLEGTGLTRYVGRAGAGVFFIFERVSPVLPAPLPPEPPALGVPAKDLLGLGTQWLEYQARGTEARTRLRMTPGASGSYTLDGEPQILPRTIQVGSSGIQLLALRLWSQTLQLNPPRPISTYRLALEQRPSFLWHVPKPALRGPQGQALQSLSVRTTWSMNADEASWAESGSGPYATPCHGYLRFDFQALAADGKPLPLYQEVFALRERIGFSRICKRTGTGPVSYWDLVDYR